MTRTPEDVVHAVVTLSQRGWSQRRLAKELGLSRNTVRGILEKVQSQRTQGHSALPALLAKRVQIIDAYAEMIEKLLDEFPEITAVRLHEKLQDKGFGGGYTVVKDRLRAIRGRRRPAGVERIETAPGEQGQQDWSPYDIAFTKAPKATVQCFSFVLGFSRRQYLHFAEHADFYTLIRQLVKTAEHFGGLPAEVLFDGQKSVLLRWEAGEPIYNPRFLAFATHYGFRPRVVKKARHKGKVERPFQSVEGNLLNARHFEDLAQLNAFAKWWVANKSDVKIHGTTKERPLDRFERERNLLLPLPAQPYDTAEVGYRIVSFDAFVDWDTVRYSVPMTNALDLVVVRATTDTLFIYDTKHEPIAQHGRMPKPHEPVIDEGHRPKKRGRNDIPMLVEKLSALGEVADVFAAGVVKRQQYRGVHLARTLQLRERYAVDDLLNAIERAVRYRAFDANTIERILEATATPRTLPDTGQRAAARRIQEIARQACVAPRPLEDYVRALGERHREDDDDEA